MAFFFSFFFCGKPNTTDVVGVISMFLFNHGKEH